MNGRLFLDTNVLVYLYDRSEPFKQKRASDLLDELVSAGLGMVSTQVLGELFLALTQKIRVPLSKKDAVERVEHHARIWAVVEVSTLIVLEALRGTRQHGFHYWDSQVWAAARMNRAAVLFSEDFADGSVVEGLRFVNPFATDFHIEDWI